MLRVEPRITEEYVADGRVSLAFSHMLDHGNASVRAHKAAECAGQQSPLAFWRMHDLLFERQNEIWAGDEMLPVHWAGEIDLDVDPAVLAVCLNEPSVVDKITRMDQERRDQGIRLRPTFDINGEIIQGAVPYEAFVQIIDGKLAAP